MPRRVNDTTLIKLLQSLVRRFAKENGYPWFPPDQKDSPLLNNIKSMRVFPDSGPFTLWLLKNIGPFTDALYPEISAEGETFGPALLDLLDECQTAHITGLIWVWWPLILLGNFDLQTQHLAGVLLFGSVHYPNGQIDEQRAAARNGEGTSHPGNVLVGLRMLWKRNIESHFIHTLVDGHPMSAVRADQVWDAFFSLVGKAVSGISDYDERKAFEGCLESCRSRMQPFRTA